MNAHLIQRQHIANVAEQIAPMCDGDTELLQDMLEGETDFLSIVTCLHEMRARDLEVLEGITARQSDLQTRKKRVEARADKVKEQIGSLLRIAQLSKVELPDATYSVRDGKPALKVVNEAAVPDEFLRQSFSPDKRAINEHFAQLEALPNWLVREPANDVVTARTK